LVLTATRAAYILCPWRHTARRTALNAESAENGIGLDFAVHLKWAVLGVLRVECG
jgi:hypothetical protein